MASLSNGLSFMLFENYHPAHAGRTYHQQVTEFWQGKTIKDNRLM